MKYRGNKHIQCVVIPTPFTWFGCKYPHIKAESLHLNTSWLFYFLSPLWWCTEPKWRKLCQCPNICGPNCILQFSILLLCTFTLRQTQNHPGHPPFIALSQTMQSFAVVFGIEKAPLKAVWRIWLATASYWPESYLAQHRPISSSYSGVWQPAPAIHP